MEFKKNRLKMENIEAEEEKFPTSQIIEEDSSAYYLPPRRSNVSIILWTLFILLLITVIGAGVYYQTEKGKKFFQGLFPQLAKSEETPKKKELADSTEKLNRIVEQPYIPRSSMDPELSACINFYRDRQVGKAMVKCEEYLNRPASDSNKSVALTILGVMYDEKGRTSLAIDKLKLAIKYDANNVHAYYNLAMAYRNSGNFGEAKLIILKAKEIAPGDSKISLLAGNILSETNDPEKAIDSYKEGISRSPNDPFLSYNLALSLYKQGKAPEAIENFQKAILAAGRGQVAELSHAHLGSIYYHRGELEAAEHHFREANP
ncbi:MAG: tetratricopeptide repeat protein, partial [Leptospiraceae bacterium]|nr:tetratricopeptide repeat protein [Leptospiraceae bacterium]